MTVLFPPLWPTACQTGCQTAGLWDWHQLQTQWQAWTTYTVGKVLPFKPPISLRLTLSSSTNRYRGWKKIPKKCPRSFLIGRLSSSVHFCRRTKKMMSNGRADPTHHQEGGLSNKIITHFYRVLHGRIHRSIDTMLQHRSPFINGGWELRGFTLFASSPWDCPAISTLFFHFFGEWRRKHGIEKSVI